MKKIQTFLASTLALSMFLPTVASAFTVTYNTEPPQSDDFIGYYDVDTGETGFVSTTTTTAPSTSSTSAEWWNVIDTGESGFSSTTTSTSVPFPVYDDILVEIPESDLDLLQKLTYQDLVVILSNIYYSRSSSTKPTVETTGEMLEDLVKHGILEEKPLDSTITREEAAYYLYSALDMGKVLDIETGFADHEEINPQYTGVIAILLNWEVICGNDDNTFAPTRTITTWEFSIMANNLIKNMLPLLPEKEVFVPTIPESSSGEMEDAYKMEALHHILYTYCLLYEFQENYSGWDDEIISWDTKNGGFTSNKENSSFLSYLSTGILNEYTHYRFDYPAFSDWGKEMDVSFHITEKTESGEGVTFVIYTENEVLAALSHAPVDIFGNDPEENFIWDELKMTLPTNLEIYGNKPWGNTDTIAFKELEKVCTIAMSLLEDLEKSVGTTITWHTTATDGIYVSTDEPEGNAPVLEEINSILGENGENLGVAVSDWGKASDLTLTIALDENQIPHVYTDNHSAAYRVNISTSATDSYDVPKTDPTPDENEETMYEYYAMEQDFTMLGEVLAEYFTLLFQVEHNLSVGDTFTWKLDRENASQFVVHQQHGTTLQDIVDAVLSRPNRHNLPSASEILETVDATFEVGLSEQGDLFFFTDDPFLSTSLTLPINDKEEYKKIDVEHDWMIMVDNEEGWWREEFGPPSSLHADYYAANELVKISMIATAMSEEVPLGVTIIWHTDLPEGSSEPNVTVEGGTETARAFMEAEIIAVLGENGMPFPQSEEAMEIPFALTVMMEENGIPRLFAHDAFWGEVLGLQLLDE